MTAMSVVIAATIRAAEAKPRRAPPDVRTLVAESNVLSGGMVGISTAAAP